MSFKFDINKLWTTRVYENDYTYFVHGDGQEQYELASLSKAFTALAIVLLSLEGKLSLDDDVSVYDKQLRFKYKGKKDYPVTFRNLLQHTAGLDDKTIRFQVEGNYSIKQTATKIAHSGLVSKPNEVFRYATGGYVVLGALVEIVSGMSFSDYVDRNIFVPLKMYSSDASGKNLKGYKMGLLGYRPLLWKGCGAFVPAGYIKSSANDMTIFLQALVNGNCSGRIKQALEICQDSNNYVKTKKDSIFYGFGWFWDKKLNLYYHDGCNPGFTTFMSYRKNGVRTYSIWLMGCNEGSFSRNARLFMEGLVKGKRKKTEFRICNHFFERVLFYIELLILIMILKYNIQILLWWISCIIFLSITLFVIAGKLSLRQMFLWTNIIKLGILYNSLFLGGMIIVYAFFNHFDLSIYIGM